MVGKRVGVLSLQGDFEAHGRALEKAGAQPVYVRTAANLKEVDGLVMPGGESTTMLKLLKMEAMMEPLAEFAGLKPILATCAGVILLAKEVSHPQQESLGVLDLSVRRNGYGRQIDSRIVQLEPSSEFQQRTAAGPLEAVFIRAPIIERVGANAEILISYLDHPVLVEQGRHLAATFHPELTGDFPDPLPLFDENMKQILFVCIGNCCRSQMAEGFANFYGKDVLKAASAGLSPTRIVAQETIETMAEKNIDISRHYPKKFDPLLAKDSDIIVNMSGFVLPGKLATQERKWEVRDPFGDSMDIYRTVSNDIEMRVMQLILELRRLAGNK